MGSASTHARKGGAVTDFDPQKVDSFIKALNAMNAIHPMIGFVVALIGVITGTLTLINNFRTKKNTKANNETAELLKTQMLEMENIKNQGVTAMSNSVKEFNEVITTAKAEVLKEMRTVKLGVMKGREKDSQTLAMIPKVQDAINHLNQRLKVNEESSKKTDKKLDALLSGLERIRKGSSSGN